MDPQLNLDGSRFHAACARCSDCQCQITVSNFTITKSDSAAQTLLCTTHYLKRFGEAGGTYCLDSSKFVKKSERDALAPDVLLKAMTPAAKAADGLVTNDLPEGLSFDKFNNSFATALQQTNAAAASGGVGGDFPYEDSVPLEARRRSLQYQQQQGASSTAAGSIDFPTDAADLDSRVRSLQEAYDGSQSLSSGGGGDPGAATTDFPFDAAPSLEARKRAFVPAPPAMPSPATTPAVASLPLAPPALEPKTEHLPEAERGFDNSLAPNSAGLREGSGRFVSQSGALYDGQWSSSLMQGFGTVRLSNGSEYTGELRASKFHGQGSLVSAHGYAYEGEWQNGRYHGQGRLTYSDGKVVVGVWENDVLIQGVQAYPDL